MLPPKSALAISGKHRKTVPALPFRHTRSHLSLLVASQPHTCTTLSKWSIYSSQLFSPVESYGINGGSAAILLLDSHYSLVSCSKIQSCWLCQL